MIVAVGNKKMGPELSDDRMARRSNGRANNNNNNTDFSLKNLKNTGVRYQHQHDLQVISARDVFLYIPNLIGYVRMILIVAFYYYTYHKPAQSMVCYLLAALLDNADGFAARKLHQCSKFGAALDMLLDKVAYLGLVNTLIQFYPSHAFWFQLSSAIDLAGHWMYTQATTASENSNNHKIVLRHYSLLRWYYSSENFLNVVCFGNQVFYICLYLMNFTEGLTVFGVSLIRVFLYASLPVLTFRTLTNINHIVDASIHLVKIDVMDKQEARRLAFSSVKH
ncbi:CDP-diacylglycerol--inositol 3-phosphatidyltransferase-like [Clavelina lepadiformis]|uniref:CDP-diacylglycerol--inositol 3-phosphatidyltransferase-like n=1 Tax=Clavelina lepadiformis TaxID=159417 RepID=UPI004042CEEA